MAFNPKSSRSKRPCPIWVDAFQRDTQHLEADEIGAYFLILMAMWTRETCDFPDDDNRLARVSRVSSRLWKSRIGPVIREFLTSRNGFVISKRLREEATYVERQVKQQSDRKTGEKSDKPLENNNQGQSTDSTMDQPRYYPSQQPNNPTVDIHGGSSAGAREHDQTNEPKPEFREKIREACGVDSRSGLTGRGGSRIGTEADMILANRWIEELGLTEEQIVANVEAVMGRKRDGPPSSLTFFAKPMARLAAEIQAARTGEVKPEPLKAIPGGRSDRSAQHASFDATLRETIKRVASGEVDLGSGEIDPFQRSKMGDRRSDS